MKEIKEAKEKLQAWALENEPSDNMIYKNGYWNNIVFIRDTILGLLYNEEASKKFPTSWASILEYANKQYDIIGKHMSKSIYLPVLKLTYKGIEIVFRYNFYNYEVTVISDKDIELPAGLFESNDDSTFYYEGFPVEYMLNTPYTESKQKFTVRIWDSYKFYTFIFLLKAEVDKWKEK